MTNVHINIWAFTAGKYLRYEAINDETKAETSGGQPILNEHAEPGYNRADALAKIMRSVFAVLPADTYSIETRGVFE